MITTGCQRWTDRRSSYRPAGETIVPSRFEVASIPGDRQARDFVERHHYSGSFPAARERFGLYERGSLVGVAVFSQPVNNRTLEVFPDPASSVELGRFVLLDEVPANGETWFLSRAFELLRREGYSGIVSFTDPLPRQEPGTGRLVFKGHIGTIYQASSAVYAGRSLPDTMHLLPDGSVLNKRTLQKIRSRCQGWRYACGKLERFGAAPLLADEDSAAWLNRWLPLLAVRVRHPGNHRYLWQLDKRQRRALPAGLPYPKWGLNGYSSIDAPPLSAEV